MRRRLLRLWLPGLLGCVVALSVAVSPSSAAQVPVWGSAIEVPGSDALNGGGEANLNSVSCAGAGNCAGGGYYYDGFGLQQAFVVDETNGSWGNAIEVPGTATLNVQGTAAVTSVSCSSAGNCTAGGSYYDSTFRFQAFVVDETNGSWGTAIEVPGTSTLNAGDAKVFSLSCATAGNCAAGGIYHDSSHRGHAWVADETNGTWGTAIEVPGTATLNSGGLAQVNSVSCPTAGNCTAGGSYKESSGRQQAFVVDETNGTWGTAIESPGTATLNSGGSAAVRSVSCPTTGNCAAGGFYTDSSGRAQAFVTNETNGTWGTAIEVPGTAILNSGGNDRVVSVSCATAGNCAGGGYYNDGSGLQQAFVVSETNGTWGTAIEVPGTATLNSDGEARVNAVSCSAAGSCSAGGYYVNDDGEDYLEHAFVVDETSGIWRTVIEVPGMATLSTGGYAAVNSVSCATDGTCAAGGFYYDYYFDGEVFVAGSALGDASTSLAPASASGIYGGTTTLSATLTSGGIPVPNETVNFTLNGASAGSASTNANGVATLPNVSLAGIDGGSYPTGVAASFAGDSGNNYVASSGSNALTISKIAQAIAISIHAPADASAGDHFTVAATGGGSGNPVIYGSSGSCSNVGATFTMTGSGSCTITYDQAGNAGYSAAPQLIDTVNGHESNQTIQITIDAPASAAYGTGFTVAATGGGSGNPIVYGSSGACTNVGANFTMTGSVGTCTVTYDQAGNANYNAAPQKTESVTAARAGQTIQITTDAPATAGYGTGFTVAATGGGSGNAMAYGSLGACTNVGADFTMTSGTGTCTVTFNQAGNTNYNAATQKTEAVTAVKVGQTITFTTPASHTYGNPDFDAGATSSSGDVVSYGASGACSIVSGNVHLAGAGSCSVTANQAGDTNYYAAPQVQRTFSVGKAALSITAKDQQKLFAQSLTLGTTAFSASGLVGSDSVAAVTLTSSGTAATAASGSYPIVPSNVVAGPSTNLAGNYTITLHNGTLSVLAAGIVGLNGVSISASGGKIDSFNSTHGVYGSSNHGSAALVMSNGPLSFSGVSLFGSATSTHGTVSVAAGAGVSGNVTAGTTASILGIVGGTVTQHAPFTALPVPSVVACSAFSAKTGISGGSFAYSSGNLTVKSGTVKLSSKTYCFKNVSLSAGSTLSVSGPVTINLTGKLTGKGQISSATNLPARLHIISSYSGSGGVAIVGGKHTAMTILAPKTSATIAGGSFFGTLLAGTVNLTGGIQFHADQH